jgi:hypothetical protein
VSGMVIRRFRASRVGRFLSLKSNSVYILGMRHCPRIAVTGALLALTIACAKAQDAPANPPIAPFNNFFVALGNAFSNVDLLNARFDSTKYDAIAGHGYSIGAGAYVPFGRALFGAEYHAADFGFESSSIGRTNKMNSAYWMGTVGYAFYTTWQFNFLGFLGVGEGTTKLVVSDRNGGATVATNVDPLFNDILSNPGFSSTINGTYTLVQPGIGVDYLMLRSEKSQIGVTFGIRLGTTISPHRTAWTYEGRNVVGAPDAGPVGSFVRLTLGVGGFKLTP